jgi:hypothetical protein
MARLARVVVPGVPHHVTQRGNRRANVFFDDGDRRRYLAHPDALACAGLGRLPADPRREHGRDDPPPDDDRPAHRRAGFHRPIARLEGLRGRILHPQKPGPKPKTPKSGKKREEKP